MLIRKSEPNSIAELECNLTSQRDQGLARLTASQREILATCRWIDQGGTVPGVRLRS